MVEYSVSDGLIFDRVLSCQSHTARAYHDHYEQVEVAQVDDEVTETTKPAKKSDRPEVSVMSKAGLRDKINAI